MTTWPTGLRDTTEFPEFGVEIGGELRPHLKGFLSLDGLGWQDYESQKAASGLDVEDSRMRTYRKMYEQLGMVYRKGDQIALSRLGHQLAELKFSVDQGREKVARAAVDILSRYQFKNPVDDPNGELPDDFDIFPFVAIWQVMLEADGKLHPQELNRVLLKTAHMADVPAAIQRILTARSTITDYSAADPALLGKALGSEVVTDQPAARMAAWFSAAGWGGLVIERKVDALGFRKITPLGHAVLPSVLSTPPKFFQATDVDDWFRHYIGTQTAPPNTTSSTAKPRLTVPKPFVLLAGLSGTGKTRFVREQATASRTGNVNFCLVPVRPDWHDPSCLLGYLSRIGIPRYVVTDLLRFVVAAWRDAFQSASATEIVHRPASEMTTYWLCLDEMNLAPVEQYFADYLAVLETRRWTGGTYSCDPILKAEAFNESAPVREQLRKDLEIADARYDGLWEYFQVVGIPIPPNIIVAGTVNMDETTHGFSRKVIDRAFTIDFGEFFPNDPDEFFAPTVVPSTLTFSSLSSVSPHELTAVHVDPNGAKSIQFFSDVNAVLRSTPFELAYRALNELLMAVVTFAPSNDAELQAVWDDFLMSKVLPRIDGDAEKLGFSGEESILTRLLEAIQVALADVIKAERRDFFRVRKDGAPVLVSCRSRRKLQWMQNRLEMSGFSSFWP